MKVRSLLFLALCLSASFASADILWQPSQPIYKLQAHHLFLMRKELGSPLFNALKPIRDQNFFSENDLRQALDQLMDDEQYHLFADTLVEKAYAEPYQIGVEFLQNDLIALHARITDQESAEAGLTARTWLPYFRPKPDDVVTWQDGTGRNGRLQVSVDGSCLHIFDHQLQQKLLDFCSAQQQATGVDALVQFAGAEQVLGLGQEFTEIGSTSVNRLGDRRNGRNLMEGFNEGANGNTLFPMAYVVDDQKQFGLFLDNRYPQEWDLREQPAKLRVEDGDFVLYVFPGDSLADLRQQFMRYSGAPTIPPKSAFGFWLSEYGFEDWAELDDKLKGMEQANLPVSGAVLDLQWFGDIQGGSQGSQMGSLTWDLDKFPEPENKIAQLKQQGMDIMLIEEAYVNHDLDNYRIMGSRGYLAHDGQGNPIATDSWWGRGGMVDFTNPQAGAFWHDYLRQPLIEAGVVGHWTDLGEPETQDAEWRYGKDGLLNNEAINNSFNVEWIRSIFAGYLRNNNVQRPFIMSRSGGVGIQHMGAAMWSGDIGSDFGSLAQQMPQQTHMMWSGIDYYGSDIGGFHRQALQAQAGDREAALNDLYTQWLAYAALFEVPVRAHTSNLCNCKETSPALIGDLESNRASLNIRYELIPYLYSLAHLAYDKSEPVFPSLAYYFQQDRNTWAIGHQKMIGSFLTAAAVAERGAQTVELYLPQGLWFDYRQSKMIVSEGEWLTLPIYKDGHLQLPIYARNGALIPSQLKGEPALKVFGDKASTFVWTDDDGYSVSYQDGERVQTQIQLAAGQLRLSFDQVNSPRPKTIIWSLRGERQVASVSLNGQDLPATRWQQQGNQLEIQLPSDTSDSWVIGLVW